MPAANFAAREARANRAVFSHLANATGLLDGVAVAGIFDAQYVDALGVATSGPVIVLPADQAGNACQGSKFLLGTMLDGTLYDVVDVQPDGKGPAAAVVLHLREAA